MAQMVVLSSRHLVFVMSQVLCLPPGVKDESDMLPALETSQFSGRNRLRRVTCTGYVMTKMPPQCLGTTDGSLESV